VTPLFSLMPIGGVSEIGSNHTLLRAGNVDVIVDCGILFPHEDAFDINYLIPDFSYIDESRLEAVVITHGHEDHIGALIHLLALFPTVPIHTTPFTQKLIHRKCEERGLRPKYVIYEESSVLRFGSLVIHPIHVTHSIPETFGLFVHDTQNRWGAFYASDFKYDLAPSREAPFNLEKLRRLMAGCEKNAFFIDSTNALVPGRTPSESELGPELENLLARANDRIFITMFASNVHRMGLLFELALKHDRRIVVMGRSMDNYARAGAETGHLGVSVDELLQPNQTVKGQGRLLILVSGCQGDFMSALRRLAHNEDSTFKLGSQDVVVFSSKMIPGNEKNISRIINKITETGAEVVSAYDRHIHASGHPAQLDLKELVAATLPDAYFPIHGETFFLRRHAEFVSSIFPQITTRVISNWSEVGFHEGGHFKVTAHSPLEPILIHGRDLVIERSQISQRRKLATLGSVFVSVDRVRGFCKLTTLGLPLSAEELIPRAEDLVMTKVRSELDHRNHDYAAEQLRIAVRQFFNQALGYKPVTEIHLLS
jgi:ribonuclease J